MTGAWPLELADNRVPVYYAGGRNISEFRGLPPGADGPEDWVGSQVPLPPAILGPDADPRTGISVLPDGRRIADAIAAAPQEWLGSELADAYDGSTALLVKLLDAGERLPVHCHPSRDFARRSLGSVFGKTEGWVIMRASPGAAVWIGMQDGVDFADMRRWIDGQDADAMLAAMMRLPVEPGMVVYVPAGAPHAIGPGVMLTELQEPTSFSVLAEHEPFGVDADAATLGLGWDAALSCFDLSAFADRRDTVLPAPRTLVASPNGSVSSLFSSAADAYFRAWRVRSTGPVELPEPSFAVLVVVSGAGTLAWDGGRMPVRAGQTFVVPFAAGTLTIDGDADVIACLPPVVDHR